jgi:hypothetical protein
MSSGVGSKSRYEATTFIHQPSKCPEFALQVPFFDRCTAPSFKLFHDRIF